MALLQPLSDTGSPDIDAALNRMSDRIGYRPHALATMARRPEALLTVLSMIEKVMFAPGASAGPLRWLAAYATCDGAVEAGESLPRVVAAAYRPGDGGFAPGEQALLLMSGAIGRTGSGAHFAKAARDQAGEAVLAEVALVCAAFGLFNRWNRTMETDLEPVLGGFAQELAAEVARQGGGQV